MTPPLTPTVMGYVDALTARPGEEVVVRVSVLDPKRRYRAGLVRLLCGDARPDGPPPREEAIATAIDGEHEGGEQYTDAGSYVIVENIPPLDGTVTLEVLAFPTLPGGRDQTLMALGPMRLIIGEKGRAAVVIGDKNIAFGEAMRPHWWHRVIAIYDPASGRASVVSEPFVDRMAPRSGDMERTLAHGKILRPGVVPGGPLVIAAEETVPGRTVHHFEGKLEAPQLRSGDIELRWDFARGIGTRRIEETSPHGLHGITVNAPKRAVTGSRWDGSVQDWRQDPAQYGAIHFHSDDLYDAAWTESLRFRLPADLRSGFYAVKLQASGPPFYVGFIVSPKRSAPTAKLAVLASTMTYLAYANYRRRMSPGPSELAAGALPTVDATDLLLAAHTELGSSTYDVHPDGSGVCHASARRPLFNFRPTGRFWNFSIDLCLIDWLEAEGLAYDVISDHDLHETGQSLLRPYAAILTGCHPEYHSLEMLKALEDYVAGGGRLGYLGGNGFYWRVTCDAAHPGLIELRRAEDGTRAWAEAPGDYYHASGDYGGLWRRIGRPPNRLVGIGFIAQGFDASTYYRRTAASENPRVAFLFRGINEEIIGDFGAWRGGAAGLEVDAYDQALGSPPHALVVASSEGHSNNFLLVNEEILSTARGLDGTLNPRVRADIVFFETGDGGAVLSVGSIAFIASLSHNNYENSISRLLRNAVDRFLDPTKFHSMNLSLR